MLEIDSRITKKFALWNDDYFALEPFSMPEYPYYFKCDLAHSTRINKGEYKLHCEETLKVLMANNLDFKKFETHTKLFISQKGAENLDSQNQLFCPK